MTFELAQPPRIVAEDVEFTMTIAPAKPLSLGNTIVIIIADRSGSGSDSPSLPGFTRVDAHPVSGSLTVWYKPVEPDDLEDPTFVATHDGDRGAWCLLEVVGILAHDQHARATSGINEVTDHSTGTTAQTTEPDQLALACILVRSNGPAEPIEWVVGEDTGMWVHRGMAQTLGVNLAITLLVATRIIDEVGEYEATADWSMSGTDGRAHGHIVTFSAHREHYLDIADEVGTADVGARRARHAHLRPDATDTDGGWRTHTDGTDLHASLGDQQPNDATLIRAPVGLDSATVQVLQGEMVVAEWTHSAPPSEFTTFERTLSDSEMAMVTDPDELRVRFVAAGEQ